LGGLGFEEGQAEGAIEVILDLDDDQKRWCFFMTPDALSRTGDWVPGTKVHFHFDARHMIVVSEISNEIIRRVLDYLSEQGLLEACSLPVGPE